MVTQRPTGAAPRRARLPRVKRTRVALVATFALLFAYYAWTATSSGNPFNQVTPFLFQHDGKDYYNLQADAFLHGHLWVDVPIAPEIQAMDDPYKLDESSPVLPLVDASLYKGHYFLPWGPAPAVTTFVPARLLGVQLRENLAVTLYLFFGVLLAVATLARLVRRLVPGTPRYVTWAGGATLALATAIPWILRRPTVYEVAIGAGFLFAMAGLLVVVREALAPGRMRTSRLVLAGVLFGLTLLSRANLVAVLPGVLLLVAVLRGDGHLPRRLTPSRGRALACLVGIPIAAGVIFMLYNAARFSGPLDFGNRWQMGGRDARELPYNDLANVAPSLYGYLVAPLRLTLGFPFVHLPPPPEAPIHGPAGFAAEQTASVLWAVPFALLALAMVVPAMRRREREHGGEPDVVARAVGALLLCSALPLLLGVFAVPGYTERYELDFLPYAAMAATLAWAALIARAPSVRRATWWRRGGLALAAWSVLVGVAIGFTGYYDSFKTNDEDGFRALERLAGPLPTLAAAVAGRPLIADVSAVAGYEEAAPSYARLDVDGGRFVLYSKEHATVTVISPGRRDATLTAQVDANAAGTFTLAAGGETAAVGTGTPLELPVHLKRGVNYVDLTVRPDADVGAPSGRQKPGVRLTDLRVG
jgi:hypothetical protein